MSTPTCPKCKSQMKLRNGKFGEFYGCSRYPKCNGIVNLPTTKMSFIGTDPKQLRKISQPSAYQKAILDWVVTGSGNAVVNATAGSGKTTTIEHVVAILVEMGVPMSEIIYTVFNSHVQKSAQEKGLPAQTTHSISLQAITSWLGRKPKIDDRKVNNIIKNLIQESWDEEKWLISTVCDLVSKVKNTLCPTDNTTLDKICDRFGIETNGSSERIFELVRLALAENNEQVDVIDFDDMLYFVHKMKIQPKQYRWVLVDEAQDFNKAQISLVLKLSKGRSMFVGDRNQSMYAFRGAAIDAMDNIIQSTQAIELPLTISYRNPKSHVALINDLLPNIIHEASDFSQEGQVDSISNDRMLGQVQAGDLVLCRTNAPLVKPVFSLIRRGVKAIIRGRDIGQGLITLIQKFNVITVTDLLLTLKEYECKEVSKLMKAEKTNQAQILQDKVDTIIAISEGCDLVNQVVQKIEEVFSDLKEGVVFSTVHKAKGDEANSVYILKPELMPHPMAQKEWEVIQEQNILFVALSRAKENLVFVGGGIPSQLMFEKSEEMVLEQARIQKPVMIIEQKVKETERPFIAQVEEIIVEGQEIEVADKMIKFLKPEIKQVPDCPF